MKYIVAIIHNNSLIRVKEVESEEEGKNLIRGWAEEQFERGLEDEEIDDLENSLEISNMEDADNHYCFSVGIID